MKICILGSLCHLSSVPLSAPRQDLPPLKPYYLETILACHWEGVRLPQSFWKLPALPRVSLKIPRSSLATCPELLSLLEAQVGNHPPKILKYQKLGEAKPGDFQTRVFPTFFGKGPDCVADPFGTVPRRCS